MAKIGLRNISQFLFGRPLDKIDSHILKYALQVFAFLAVAQNLALWLLPTNLDSRILLFLLSAWIASREIHSHARYHYEAGNLDHTKERRK